MLTLDRHGRTLRFEDADLVQLPYVYRPLLDGKAYEEPFLEHIRGRGRRGVYIDVGAHLGTHTVWFATLCPSTHVHAVEPVGRYADVVRRNVAANGLADKVTVHQVGVSDRPGEATNYLSPEHETGFVAGDASGVTEAFTVRRLDDLVQGPVAVLKLDVEGMETAVLRGATRILSRHRPLVYAEARTAEEAEQVRRFLGPFGYRPTGLVFNSSPTYEYEAAPRKGVERLRPLWRQVPPGLRRRARRLMAAASSGQRSR